MGSVPTPSASRLDASSDLLETLISFNMKTLMPKTEVPHFDGSYTEFQTFIRAFDNVISSKLVNEEEKLLYLCQCTSGKPYKIVKACMHLKTGGYSRARALLEKRYGSPEKIVAAYISEILDWGFMTSENVESLDEFSILMRNCENAILGLDNGITELEHPKTMREVMKKFPYSTQEKWRSYVDNIVEKQCRPVKFADLVNFTEDQARIATNVDFGRKQFQQAKGREEKFTNSQVRKNQVSVNAVDMTKIKCWHCEGNHFIESCTVLKNMPFDERVSIIKGKKLCFRCFDRGHSVANCTRKRTCEVCGDNHNTMFHKDGTSDTGGTFHAVTSSNRVVTSSGTVPDTDNQNARLNVIPVKVHALNGRSVCTYAFLDPGSTATFCTTKLCHQLGLPSKANVNLSIQTIGPVRENVLTCVVEGLSVSDVAQTDLLDYLRYILLSRYLPRKQTSSAPVN